MTSPQPGALPELLELVAAMPPADLLQDDIAINLDRFCEAQCITARLQPVISGGLLSLCHLMEEHLPRHRKPHEIDQRLLGHAIHDLIGLDAFLNQLVTVEGANFGRQGRWGDYRLHLLPINTSQAPLIVRLLHELAATEMDEFRQLKPAPSGNLTRYASAVRWKVLTPASSLAGSLLASAPYHSQEVTARFADIAAFVRECHAGARWLDAIPDRLCLRYEPPTHAANTVDEECLAAPAMIEEETR